MCKRDSFNNLRELKAEGRTVMFISHKLDEVLSVADDITVIRRGTTVAEVDPKTVNARQLAELMVGMFLTFLIMGSLYAILSAAVRYYLTSTKTISVQQACLVATSALSSSAAGAGRAGQSGLSGDWYRCRTGLHQLGLYCPSYR